jgi:transposase
LWLFERCGKIKLISLLGNVMDNSIRIPLDLPDVRVLEMSQTERGEWLLKLESTAEGTTCHNCGRHITEFHGYDQPVRVRHLPLFETPVYVEYRPKRYRCRHCQGHPTTTQRLSWHPLRSPNTKPYEDWLLRLLINSTVADVARKVEVSQEIVEGTLERWVAHTVDWDEFERLGVIGIDEIALKRGHRDFVVIVTTLSQSGVAILAVLPDRKQQTVAQFLASIPQALAQTIERVCSDMYLGYVGAVAQQLPQAKVVVDRFHIAKAYRSCADSVRKQEMKQLKQSLAKEDYEQLKGAMWAFRKRPEDLKPIEQQVLERLFESSARSEEAYQLREALTQIFERDYSKRGAKCAIRAWCKRVEKSGIRAFDSFLTTVENWLDEIANYFLERWTSGFVEGFNNRVKVMKRRCYGIFDVKRLFQRLSLDLNGYA